MFQLTVGQQFLYRLLRILLQEWNITSDICVISKAQFHLQSITCLHVFVGCLTVLTERAESHKSTGDIRCLGPTLASRKVEQISVRTSHPRYFVTDHSPLCCDVYVLDSVL